MARAALSQRTGSDGTESCYSRPKTGTRDLLEGRGRNVSDIFFLLERRVVSLMGLSPIYFLIF